MSESTENVSAEAQPVSDPAAIVTPEVDLEALLAHGRRDLVCGDTQKAVSQLQEACRLLAAKHGETADECAEAYFLYGRALLELSRMESGVLGNALQGIATESQETEEKETEEEEDNKQFAEPDSYTAEEKEKISDDILDAMLEPEVTPPEGENNKQTEKNETADNPKSVETKQADETKVLDSESIKPVSAVESDISKKVEDGDTSEKKMEDSVVTSSEPSAVEASASEAVPVVEAEKSAETSTDKAEESSLAVESSSKDTSDEAKTALEGVEKEKSVETESTSAVDNAEKTGEDDEGEEEEGDEDDDEAMEEDAPADDTATAEDEDDVSNLQVAWEMLELAKNIYKKHDTDEMKLKQADCLLKLGEIGLESEQHTQAIDDFKACLDLQSVANLSATDRRFAETWYQLGVAHSSAASFDDAIESFRKATSIIEARVAELMAKAAEVGGKKMDEGDSSASASEGLGADEERELKELRDLLPEIFIKIEDAEEDKRNASKVKDMLRDFEDPKSAVTECTTNGFSEAINGGTSDAKPVSNVMHLVRRKRKPDEEEGDEEKCKSEELKKLKTSDDEVERVEETVVISSESTVEATPAADVVVLTEEKVVVIVESNGHCNGGDGKDVVTNGASKESEPVVHGVADGGDVVESMDASDGATDTAAAGDLPDIVCTKTVEDVKSYGMDEEHQAVEANVTEAV